MQRAPISADKVVVWLCDLPSASFFRLRCLCKVRRHRNRRFDVSGTNHAAGQEESSGTHENNAIASHCLAPFAFLATSCTAAPFASESDGFTITVSRPDSPEITSTVLPYRGCVIFADLAHHYAEHELVEPTESIHPK